MKGSTMSTGVPRMHRFSQATRFLRVARLLLWTIWVIYRERSRVIRARERGNNEARPNVAVLVKVLVAFRKTALELGGLMIKLGQFLSSRADLLPEQALQVLSTLQDEVPAAPFSHVVAVIEAELGKPIDQLFTVLERKPTAAASLGQVHKAVLASTGETVAVKVQRPHIEQLVNLDLNTISFVISLLTRFVNVGEFIDLRGFFREFKRTTLEEIDYTTEASNAKRFKEMFKDRPAVFIPRIYDEYTSQRVLILEWVDGIKINDYPALEAAGIDRQEVARRTVEAYFYQFFEAGFFHADPHPGNIFVQKGTPEEGPIIALVDFGMVGSLTASMKKSIKDLFLGFLAHDSHMLVGALQRLGFIGAGANKASIERAMGLLLEQYYGLSMSEARELDFPDVAQDIENLLYGQPFQIPAQFAFTGRAVATLAGVATGLAPAFNLVDVALPYAQKFLGLTTDGIGQTLQQVLEQLLATGRTLLTLPGTLERVISKLETGQIEVKFAEGGVAHGRSSRRRRRGNAPSTTATRGSAGGLSWVLSIAVTLAGGIVLTINNAAPQGWFCLGLTGIIALGSFIKR